MTETAFYPIGTPGQAWGPAEFDVWRARQVRHRRYADDVVSVIDRLRDRFDVEQYGEVVYGDERHPLFAIRSRHWDDALPCVLVTGGVHGYETSGVHGALRFVDQHAEAYAGQVNLLVAPASAPGPTNGSTAGTTTASIPTARSASPAPHRNPPR